jgi:hypothetical protein
MPPQQDRLKHGRLPETTMFSRTSLPRIAALLALAAFLPGCAAYHCNGLPNRDQCYAAYDEYEHCQYVSKPLIRQVGVSWREECRTETSHCGRKDRRCIQRTREVCRSTPEPIYDYRDYNIGVSQCMRGKGLVAYDQYFNRSPF